MNYPFLPQLFTKLLSFCHTHTKKEAKTQTFTLSAHSPSTTITHIFLSGTLQINWICCAREITSENLFNLLRHKWKDLQNNKTVQF